MNFCLLAKKIRGSPFTVNPGLFWAVFLQPLHIIVGSFTLHTRAEFYAPFVLLYIVCYECGTVPVDLQV